ncbi:glycosyltransferase family A protein [Adlercreutzia sp. ZJ154]|uniref:glycosyltransferase family A protein n=1 Tax=Adlercreutzia sp. ZJ154 TaxID=2709790 RepID=UPI0013ED9AB8|nr:glycosyltransferase family A protein [Adlercreutzia sp. ZJ154]
MNSEVTPLMSIIVPCYNMERYLPNMMNSVLNQTYPSIEVLAVDDGSQDDTLAILRRYETRFEECGYKLIVIHKKNGGAASAINAALPLFSGEYLMWVDGDDILLPNNVKKKVDFLQNHPEYGFVLCKGVVVFEDDISTPCLPMWRVKPAGEDTLFEDLVMERNVVYGPGVVAVRAEAIRSSIPSLHIFESVQGQNWQLMLPLAYRECCGYIDEILFKCVAHTDSHSRRERTYKECIQRQYDFQELICITIESIPDINDIEIEKWHRKVALKHARNRLREAYRENNRVDIDKFRNEIARCGEYNLEDKWRPLWFITKTKNAVVERFKAKIVKQKLESILKK